MLTIPDGLLGREMDLGSVAVTSEMIAAYARAVGDEATLAGPLLEAPATFCLTLRRGLTPDIVLPPRTFALYGGHDIEIHLPIRAGETYRVTARIADVFEKSGRSGRLTVVVRESIIGYENGRLVARIVERQIVRPYPETGHLPPVPPLPDATP